MAQVSFETAFNNNYAETPQNNTNRNNVSFFFLKNNGDSAIVRFMESSITDFNLLSCHPIQLNGKFRQLNCLRGANDPIDNCPACKANMKTATKFYVRMLQYVPNEQGVIEAKPVVWERSLNYASQIRDLIMNYGDLKNCIFKITRNGAAGDMKTTYNIMYCPEQMYPQEKYPIVENAFDNYNPLGTIVLNKTAGEIETYIATNNFPAPIPPEAQSQPQVQQQFTPQPTPQVTPQPIYSTTPAQPSVEPLPWETQTQQVNRPIRTY